MHVHILYSNESSTTGKEMVAALISALSDHTNIKVTGGKEAPKVDVLIRWGSRATVPLKPVRYINSLKGLTKASNKLKSLDYLKAAGIKVPTVYMADDPNIQFPCLGRKEHHVGGTDIELCMQMSDYFDVKDKCAFWTKYIPTRTEYRVHVYRGEKIKVSQKTLTNPDARKNVWIRNFENGYTFMQPKDKPKSHAIGMAVDAVDALDLNFGAVDLIIGDNGEPVVLEVNTAPGAKADSTLEAYVTAFKADILNG